MIKLLHLMTTTNLIDSRAALQIGGGGLGNDSGGGGMTSPMGVTGVMRIHLLIVTTSKVVWDVS